MIAGLHTSRIVGLLGASTEGMRRGAREADEVVRSSAAFDGVLEDGERLAAAETMFKANAAVAQRANRMVGTILDALA